MQGNQNHYQANINSPVFEEIINIVKKTFGIKGVLQAALTPIILQLERAFVYGSIAKGEEQASSDVDLMLVGQDLIYSEIMQLLDEAESQLQRPVNPTIYTPDEFAIRLKDEQSFLSKVMSLPRIDLLPKGDW